MKIAQITWIAYPNYGSSLQAYALQQSLRELGHESVIIDDTRYTWLANSPRNIYYRCRWFLHHPQRTWRLLSSPRPFRRFADHYLAIDRQWQSPQSLASDYDTFVCGSDQIWSPILPDHFNGFYFAAFVPSGKRKIAYAPSLGSKTAPEEYGRMVRPWLESFDVLSTREESGSALLSEITGRADVATVVDPTLLLPSEKWGALCSNDSRRRIAGDGEYLLAYFLTYNEAYLRRAREIADARGCKLLILGSDRRMKQFADIFPGNIGPDDFISLVSGAAYVVTDSFHGTIFAFHFRRPFLTVKRFKDDAKNCQNSRIENLFKILNITDNLRSESELATLPAVPDWTAASAALEPHRQHSLSYLKNALK